MDIDEVMEDNPEASFVGARESFDLNRGHERRMHGTAATDHSAVNTDSLGFEEGGSGSRVEDQIPVHLLPAVKEWLKERGIHVNLPSSPLQPRLSQHTVAQMSKGQSPEKFRPARVSSRLVRANSRSPYPKRPQQANSQNIC
jgi:hypothetical protein